MIKNDISNPNLIKSLSNWVATDGKEKLPRGLEIKRVRPTLEVINQEIGVNVKMQESLSEMKLTGLANSIVYFADKKKLAIFAPTLIITFIYKEEKQIFASNYAWLIFKNEGDYLKATKGLNSKYKLNFPIMPIEKK